jgi:hypothetical protein
MTVPAVEVSLTVAVQLVAWFTTTDAGAHDTLVEVVRGLTLTGKGAIVALAAWEASPG